MDNYQTTAWYRERRFLYPEYKRNNTIVLLGWASSSRHLAPYERAIRGEVDLMSLNEAAAQPWYKGGANLWLQVHPRWDFMRANNRSDPTHPDWLHEDHGFPIFMQDKFYDVPNSVRYPIEEAYDLSHGYLTSSFAYMMSLAILMGYERIEIYGFDMSHDSEFGDQKPCAEYLIGKAEGLGVQVYLPPVCPLLRGNLYAYEDLRAADHTYFVVRLEALEKEFERHIGEVNYRKGHMDAIQDLVNSPDDDYKPLRKKLAQLYMEKQKEAVEAQTFAAGIGGQVDELRALIAWHESQNVPSDRKESDPNESQNSAG